MPIAQTAKPPRVRNFVEIRMLPLFVRLSKMTQGRALRQMDIFDRNRLCTSAGFLWLAKNDLASGVQRRAVVRGMF